MSGGFQVLSDSGGYAIDQNFAMLEFKAKYRVFISASMDGTVIETPGLDGEVFAVGQCELNHMVAVVARSDGTWTFRTVDVGKLSISGQYVTLYLFAMPDQVSPVHHAGMVIYREDGAVAYNSDSDKWLNVLGHATIAANGGTAQLQNENTAVIVKDVPACGIYGDRWSNYLYEGRYQSVNVIYASVPAVKVYGTTVTVALARGEIAQINNGVYDVTGWRYWNVTGTDLTFVDVSNL